MSLTFTQKKLLYGLLIISALFVAYVDSLHGPFVFDDAESILKNVTIGRLDNFRWLHPPADGPLGGRPLANLTFSLNYALGGIDVLGYHLFNFILHAASSLLLFAVLVKFLKHPGQKEAIRTAADILALVCALAWGLHPLSTASVTYISQRTEELMGFFYLVVIFSYWKAVENSSNRAWTELAVLASFAGVACKEGMATAPLMVLLIDRTLHSESFADAIRKRRVLYIGLFSSWIFLLFLWFGTKDRGVGLNLGIHWYQYALTESRVIFQYLRIILIPKTLVLDYGLSPYRPYVEEIPYAVGLLVIVGVVFYLLWKKSLIGLAAAWFLVLLAPSSTVIPVAYEPMGDNRLYLPSAGILVLLFCLIYLGMRKWAWPIFITVLSCYAYETIQRNDDYVTAVKVWTDTIAKVPSNFRSYNNLGLALYSEGRFEEADEAFNDSIKLNSRWAEPVKNKGEVALQRGNLEEAEKWFDLAIQIYPDGEGELSALAALLVQKGEFTRARPVLAKGMRLHPQYALNWDVLGQIMSGENKLSEAIEDYQKAISLAPYIASFHNNLGEAFLRENQFDAATNQFLIAVRLKSTLAKAQSNLAAMFAQTGDYPRAIIHYLYALQGNPADVGARINLGEVYQKIAKTHAAYACYRESLRREPDNLRAQALLKSISALPVLSEHEKQTGSSE